MAGSGGDRADAVALQRVDSSSETATAPLCAAPVTDQAPAVRDPAGVMAPDSPRDAVWPHGLDVSVARRRDARTSAGAIDAAGGHR
jgi:hypothetical protein